MPTLLSLDRFSIDRRLVRLVKALAIGVTASALALELCNLYLWLNGNSSPLQGFNILFAFGRFVLICHGIEGAIAATLAPSKRQPRVWSGLYTFFVGTVGLLELLKPPEQQH